MQQVAGLHYQPVDLRTAATHPASRHDQPISDTAEEDRALGGTGDSSCVAHVVSESAQRDDAPASNGLTAADAPAHKDGPVAVRAGETCVLCMDAAADAVLLECGHGGLCAGLARRPAACVRGLGSAAQQRGWQGIKEGGGRGAFGVSQVL